MTLEATLNLKAMRSFSESFWFIRRTLCYMSPAVVILTVNIYLSAMEKRYPNELCIWLQIALKWFCSRSLLCNEGLSMDLIDRLPGKQNDRTTPLGELNWIFTAITDTIAWNTLPRGMFQKLFRQVLYFLRLNTAAQICCLLSINSATLSKIFTFAVLLQYKKTLLSESVNMFV